MRCWVLAVLASLKVIWVAQVVHLLSQKLSHLMFHCSPEFPKCHVIQLFSHPWPTHQHSHYPTSRADLLSTSLKKICPAHLLSLLFTCQQVLFFRLLHAVLLVLNICQSLFFTLWCSFLMLLLLTISSILYTTTYLSYSMYLYMEIFVLVYPWAWMLKPRHNSIFKYILCHCFFFKSIFS